MGPSPAGSTPGGTPNGAPRPPMPRRPPPANPLLAPKRRQRPAATNNITSKPRPKENALKAPNDIKPVSAAGSTSKLLPPNIAVSLIDAATGTKTSGFSNPPAGPYTDYPVYLTKRQIVEGARFHVARFYSKQEVDLSSENQWTRPVRLHRRDPKVPPPGGKSQEMDAKDVEIEEERAKQDMMRVQRDAQRAAEQAEIAPSQANINAKRPGAGQKKIMQVLRKDETEAQRASTQLKYEESLPWLIEDFDNRQAWVGSYEAALSGTYAQFILKDGKFNVAPLEKWYKFTQKRTFKSQEELEAQEAKRQVQDPKWLKAYQDNQEMIKLEEKNRSSASRLYDGAGKGRTASLRVGGGGGSRKDKEDADELDFEEDVADDEEDPVYEGDVDETKETQKRIKKDQLQANIFAMKDEETYDKEDKLENLERQARKNEGKRVRKALMKRERNFIYDSDSDHPYSEESDSEDSKTEREEDDQTKKEGEDKKKAGQAPSGASSKGTNTPSGRKSGLKRPGSHDASEASGNESSRKKQKKHGTASTLGSGINTPNGPPSRPRSPANGTLNLDPNAARTKKPSGTRVGDLKRPRGGAGSGSDGEGAGSGGEMSDSSRKRIKMQSSQPGSKNVSPGGSRATSPNRDPTERPAKPKQPTSQDLPSVEEVKKDILPEGTKLSGFSEKYRTFFNNPKHRDPFMKMVRTISKLDKRPDGTYLVLLP